MLYLRLLVKGIRAIIPGGISVTDFAMISETDQISAKKILEELTKNGIGTKREGVFNFSSGERLKAAVFALQKGAPIEEVSEQLDWKDFEGLAAEILQSKGFATIRNLILTKPRMEIDVVGVNLGIAILVDCKHWKKSSPSSLKQVVQKQIDRTKHYVSLTPGAVAAPVIVTLYQDRVDFIDKVPIVPIFQFSSFVDEFYGNLDKIDTIKSD